MSESNPYAVGSAAGDQNYADDIHSPLIRELLTQLVQTRPWVRLFGILSMIVAVLMLIGGLFMAIGGAAGSPQLAFLGVLYAMISGLYMYPALCLNRYASAISRAESTADVSLIVEAVSQQRKFWRFCGILAAGVLILYLLGALLGIMGLAFASV